MLYKGSGVYQEVLGKDVQTMDNHYIHQDICTTETQHNMLQQTHYHRHESLKSIPAKL